MLTNIKQKKTKINRNKKKTATYNIIIYVDSSLLFSSGMVKSVTF